MEKQNEARLKAPVAGASKVMLDSLDQTEEKIITRQVTYTYSSSSTLNKRDGVFYGPSGKESYYNLPMGGVVSRMRTLGYTDRYWIRKDGVKMFGDRVMVAADLRIRPKGTILATSLGEAIVCDTGVFARQDSTALDVAVDW